MGRRGWPARLLLERAHRGLFLPYRVHYNSADRRDTLHETVSGIVCCFCCRMLRAGLRHRGSCAAAAVVAPTPLIPALSCAVQLVLATSVLRKLHWIRGRPSTA